MMKDREQKAKALRYSVAKGWFPQLEVVVHSQKALSKTAVPLTDLDLLASSPDDFMGFRSIVFDCKTGAKESAINRALWLRGVLDRMNSAYGVCILKKDLIELDHRLVAIKFGIILLAEDEFDLYAEVTSTKYKSSLGHVANIAAWDSLFALKEKYPNLTSALEFARSTYWMIDDAAEACRKTLRVLHETRAELDPAKNDHLGFVLDCTALFARSLAVLCAYLFKTHLHPKQQSELEEAVKMLLYGGREAYEYRNQIYKLLKERKSSESGNDNLSLPEWEMFIRLIRQLLDAPIDLTRTPLILREVGFSYLLSSSDYNYAKKLCEQFPQGGRFAVLIVGYLCRAAKLSPEFQVNCEKILMSLLVAK